MKRYVRVVFVLVLAARVMCADEDAGPNYVLQVDDTVSWTVTSAASYQHNGMRVHTEPPFGLPGILSRLAVFRYRRISASCAAAILATAALELA